MARNRILIVDDDAAIRFGLRDFLETRGYRVEEAATALAAEQAFRAAPPDAVISDYRLPDGDALQLLPRLRAMNDQVPVILLTGHGSVELAVQAMKEGAEHFLTKPVTLPALLVVLERSLEHQRNRQQQLARKARQERRAVDPFLGSSTAIRTLAEEARRVAGAERPVYLRGETGTGKGVLARWLHAHGPRADEAFVDLNCAGLPRELVESELFGHERGAFTGAVQSKVGLLDLAHRGTLFLDEIGDMEPALQPKFLKVLEEQRFRRVGDVRDRQVDLQLIAATHQDLAARVTGGQFRGDLYFRISTLPLAVPALRERVETSRCWRGCCSTAWRRRSGGPRSGSPPTPSRPWPATRGPGTSGSCAMSWSGPPCWATARNSARHSFASRPASARRRPRPRATWAG